MEHTHESLVQMIFLGKIFTDFQVSSRSVSGVEPTFWGIGWSLEDPIGTGHTTLCPWSRRNPPQKTHVTRNIHRNAPSFQPWCSILHHVQHHHHARWFSLLSRYPGHSIAVGKWPFLAPYLWFRRQPNAGILRYFLKGELGEVFCLHGGKRETHSKSNKNQLIFSSILEGATPKKTATEENNHLKMYLLLKHLYTTDFPASHDEMS